MMICRCSISKANKSIGLPGLIELNEHWNIGIMERTHSVSFIRAGISIPEDLFVCSNPFRSVVGPGFVDAAEIFRRRCRKKILHECLSLSLLHTFHGLDDFLWPNTNSQRCRHFLSSINGVQDLLLYGTFNLQPLALSLTQRTQAPHLLTTAGTLLRRCAYRRQ